MGTEENQNLSSQSSKQQLRKLGERELKQILEHHQRWAELHRAGRQAQEMPTDLSRTDLTGINFAGADLSYANLRGACLRGSDLRGADLQEADLSGTNLLDARLQDANLQDASLNEVDLLLSKQLAGADVAGAQLPASITKFEGLAVVEQISRNARTMMFSMLLACVYSWLTIATTTDPLLLTNSISSPLPIIRTEIPIAGFFWVAPLILLAMYLYFHIYLQRLWETLADLPAVFPDGTRLDKRAYPWLLNGLVISHFRRLRDSRPRFSRLQAGLSILLGWWTVPATLVILWLRYLPRHDWLGTTLQVGLTIAAIGSGILFYRAAIATLRREIEPAMSWKQFMGSARSARRGAFVFGVSVVLFGFSFGAIHGIPVGSEQAANINAWDLRLWVPRLMEIMGTSCFADFIEENLSTKPDNWDEKKEDRSNLALIKGARLKNADLAYARARSAFLVKADLRQVNLFGADLRDADLRQANLQDANLDYADLTGARLEGVLLQGATLKAVKLQGYDFASNNLQKVDFRDASLQKLNFEHANLKSANFEGADLFSVKLDNADLQGANFHGAKFDKVSLKRANLLGAHLIDVQGLNGHVIRNSANWIFASYNKELLAALELPAELAARMREKNLSEMKLRGILFDKADLQGFNFAGSDLQEAEFGQVNLQNADLSQTDLKKAKLLGNLSGVNFSAADLRQAEIKWSNLRAANLQRADLRGARLLELDLSNADLENANLSENTFWNWVKVNDANLKGTDLTSSHIMNARGLTCRQIRQAIIDENTRLPDYLKDCGR
ncbi:MAG: pentapeptide repeat-containing protein [Desulfobacterales bacterium]|nr:MAG: pentapeptide repeat-containing protein [Desulfobacterales bacterium]